MTKAKKTDPPHPMQPLVKVNNTIRFKENKIVSALVAQGDHRQVPGALDLNKIGMGDYSVEDREQLAQLIGYSVSGFGDLSYVRDKTYEAAGLARDALINNQKEKTKRLTLQEKEYAVKEELRKLLETPDFSTGRIIGLLADIYYDEADEAARDDDDSEKKFRKVAGALEVLAHGIDSVDPP